MDILQFLSFFFISLTSAISLIVAGMYAVKYLREDRQFIWELRFAREAVSYAVLIAFSKLVG